MVLPSPSSSEDERLWQPHVAFDLPAHRPYFDDDAWGASLGAHIFGLPRAVHAHLRVVPEGLLLHADCERCSARDEVVLDFRSPTGDDPLADTVPVELAVFGGERSRSLQRALWEQPLRAWAEKHRACAPARPRPVLAAAAGRALRTACDDAAAELRTSGVTTPCVVALDGGRRPLWLDCSGSEDADRVLLGFRLREALGAGVPPHTVLALEEVPVADGATMLRVAVLTGAGNWVGHAEIDRFDRPAPGRGVLQPLAWTRVSGSATWLDGLRARQQSFPVPRLLQRAEP